MAVAGIFCWYEMRVLITRAVSPLTSHLSPLTFDERTNTFSSYKGSWKCFALGATDGSCSEQILLPSCVGCRMTDGAVAPLPAPSDLSPLTFDERTNTFSSYKGSWKRLALALRMALVLSRSPRESYGPASLVPRVQDNDHSIRHPALCEARAQCRICSGNKGSWNYGRARLST
jgi:hypothetical protein